MDTDQLKNIELNIVSYGINDDIINYSYFYFSKITFNPIQLEVILTSKSN